MIAAVAFSVMGSPSVTESNSKADAWIRSEMQKRKVPGAQVAVVKGGKVVLLRSYGKASLQFDVPVRNSTLFTLNSATKSFTGVAVMQLVDRGLLSLSDPVSKYVDGLPSDWRPVTIEQLMTHVSGLPDIVDQSIGKLVGGLPDEEAWKKVQEMPMLSKTGTEFSYNQTNYLLIGKVIDRVSKMPFTQFIQRDQFEKLGLKNTRFGDSRDLVKNLAQAYYLEEDSAGHVSHRPTASEFPKFLWTGAGLCSTAGDVAKWILGLRSGRLFSSKKSLDRLWQRGKFNDGKPSPWAIGWPASDRTKHRWVGGIGGGRSAFFVYPDDDLAVVVLTNLAGSSPEQWIDSIARFYVPKIGATVKKN